MNAERIYNAIIEKAKKENRKKGCGVYYEKHHILPRCLKGKDTPDNVILLTAKEHFICHRLLTLIYPTSKRIAFAFWNMCRPSNEWHDRHIASASSYAYAREHLSRTYKGRPAWNKGLKLNEEQLANHATHQPGFKAWNKGVPSKYKGVPRNRAICPHCGTEGGEPQLKRWHFENCKHISQ
jgi:hypothetical protein